MKKIDNKQLFERFDRDQEIFYKHMRYLDRLTLYLLFFYFVFIVTVIFMIIGWFA